MTATMDALLIGHEDWVFSAAWQPAQDAAAAVPCLLSASMDRTMMIWRPESSSGAPCFCLLNWAPQLCKVFCCPLNAQSGHSVGSILIVLPLIGNKDQ